MMSVIWQVPSGQSDTQAPSKQPVLWHADVLRTMPSKAIELASFDMYKKTLGRLRPGGSSAHPGGFATGFAGALAGAHSYQRTCSYPPHAHVQPYRPPRFAGSEGESSGTLGAASLSGCAEAEGHLFAGLTSTLAMFPLETIRTRLAVDPKKYRNMLGAFQTVVEAEGVGALYRVRPTAPSLIGNHERVLITQATHPRHLS